MTAGAGWARAADGRSLPVAGRVPVHSWAGVPEGSLNQPGSHGLSPYLATIFSNKALDAQLVMLPGGHQQINETPEQMLAALSGFLTPDLCMG